MDSTAKDQLVSMALLPISMLSGLALGITVGAHRIVSLVLLALVMAFGTYLRRFGPRGFAAGVLLFVGYFLGFFLHAAVAMGDFGWLAAEIGVGFVVASVVRFVLFYPRQQKALERSQRSYGARARKVATLALEEASASVGADRLAVRDLMLIDGAMARMAEIMGLAITDFDTVGVGRSDGDDGHE